MNGISKIAVTRPTIKLLWTTAASRRLGSAGHHIRSGQQTRFDYQLRRNPFINGLPGISRFAIGGSTSIAAFALAGFRPDPIFQLLVVEPYLIRLKRVLFKLGLGKVVFLQHDVDLERGKGLGERGPPRYWRCRGCLRQGRFRIYSHQFAAIPAEPLLFQL